MNDVKQMLFTNQEISEVYDNVATFFITHKGTLGFIKTDKLWYSFDTKTYNALISYYDLNEMDTRDKAELLGITKEDAE